MIQSVDGLSGKVPQTTIVHHPPRGRLGTYAVIIWDSIAKIMPQALTNGVGALTSLFRRKVAHSQVEPAFMVDLPSPKLDLLQVPARVRRSLFDALFTEFTQGDNGWDLQGQAGIPEAYTPRQLNKPATRLKLDQQLLVNTYQRYSSNYDTENTDQPFYGDSPATLFSGPSTNKRLVSDRANALIARGLVPMEAVSVAVNEYLDDLLKKLDVAVGEACKDKARLHLLLPALSTFTLVSLVQIILYAFRYQNVRGDINAFLEQLQTDNSDPKYGQLIIYSTGGHAFIELTETESELSRAIGKYQHGRRKTTALKASETPYVTGSLKRGEPGFSAVDLPVGSFWLTTGKSSFDDLGNIPDLPVAMRASVGAMAPKLLIQEETRILEKMSSVARKTGASAALVDEYEAYKDHTVDGYQMSFPLLEDEYKNVSHYLDTEIEKCRDNSPQCSYSFFSNNCMHFVQDVFEQTPYPGLYVDYLPGARLTERAIVELHRSPLSARVHNVSGTLMLIATMLPFAKKITLRTCKIIGEAASWICSGAQKIRTLTSERLSQNIRSQ